MENIITEIGLWAKAATFVLLSIIGFLIKKYFDRLEENDGELSERISRIEECYKKTLDEIKEGQVKILERLVVLEVLQNKKNN